MAIQVNMLEAQARLSELIRLVEAGEEVIIARAGQPVVRLVAIHADAPRILGALVGRGWIADDFDAPLDEAFRARQRRPGWRGRCWSAPAGCSG